MKTLSLPDVLQLDPALSVQVYDYESSKEMDKQQIVLNQHTFSFLTEGTKEVVFDNSALSIGSSQFLLMKSGHCLMTEKLSNVKNYRSIILFFSNESLLRFTQKIRWDRTPHTESKSVYAFTYDAFIRRFVDSLLDISKLPNKLQKKMLEVKLEEIMLYLTGMYGTEFLHALSKHSDDFTQKFTHTVEINQLNKLTLKELAFLCHMSVSTFKREFVKHYSESPMKWFQNKRLEHAHYLLDQEQKSASEIYSEAGYENLSSFIQAYKARFGATPKQHVKQ